MTPIGAPIDGDDAMMAGYDMDFACVRLALRGLCACAGLALY
jgi:hypothetical protein